MGEQLTRWRALAALAAATGLLYALAFPPFDLWPLALVALVPALLVAPHLTVGRGFAFGLVAAAVGTAISSSWLVGSVARFFSVSALAGVGALVAVGTWIAVPWGLVVVAVAALHRGRQEVRPWASTLVLCAGESLRGALLPYPWLVAGQTLLGSTLLMQLAEVGGLTLLGALVFVTNGLIARAAQLWLAGPGLRPALRPLAIAAAVIVTAGVAGAVRYVDVARAPAGRSLRVALVQPPAIGVDAPRPHPAAYVAHSRAALEAAPDLILWPETALDGAPARYTRTLAPLWTAMGDARRALVTGAVVYGRNAAGEPSVSNSVFLINGLGATSARYDKRVLVPFGEYLPSVLANVVGAKAREEHLGAVDTSRGDAVQSLLRTSDVALAPLLCNEVLSGDLAREAVRQGADALVVLSNDAWAPSERVARLVLRGAQLRAVETRLPVMRSGYPGGSGVVLPTGALDTYLAWDESGERVVTVPLPSVTRLPDLEPWLRVACGVGALALLVAALRRRTRG